MINAKKQAAITIAVIVMMILFAAATPGMAYVTDNGAGTGYDENNPDQGSAVGDPALSIEDYIERGAGSFLMARKEVDTMLRIVELQNIEGFSISELKLVAQRALNHMNRAIATYTVLIRRAVATPYNKGTIARLEHFDYNRFRMRHRLNPDVFQTVEGFLKNGDINGIFKRKIPIFSKIKNLLIAAKADLDQNNIPRLPVLWTLNETVSQSSIFGSYVARVFQALNTNEKKDASIEVQNDWK